MAEFLFIIEIPAKRKSSRCREPKRCESMLPLAASVKSVTASLRVSVGKSTSLLGIFKKRVNYEA